MQRQSCSLRQDSQLDSAVGREGDPVVHAFTGQSLDILWADFLSRVVFVWYTIALLCKLL